MKRFYKEWNPKPASLYNVQQANFIIDEYESAGYTLTLRQLYYQFVSRDLIPNTERSYKNLGTIITKARMAGMISWDAIEDRNREFNKPWSNENLHEIVSQLPLYCKFDQWERQENYVEVWVEKEALGNIVSRACGKFDVPYMSCKGYMSSSEAWRAGQRFAKAIEAGKECTLLHFGDHDPSGIDMTRDNRERIDLFSDFPHEVHVNRVGLNMDQVDAYNPPPNPTKITDSRSDDYIKKFGNTSWELDALEPSVIEGLITSEVKALIDFSTWGEVRRDEEVSRSLLKKVHTYWDEIQLLFENK